MIKANDIKNIYKDKKKYNRLLRNEKDLAKQLKYKRILREYEYKLIEIELQLNYISIKEEALCRQLFVDKYIKGASIEMLVDKYNMSKSTIYKILNDAKELFEDRWM